MANYRIVVEVDPSRAKTGSKEVEGSLDKVERRARGVQVALTRAFAILGIGGGLIGTIGLLANFEQAMSTVKGVTGATEKQFRSLREEAQRLGSTTRFTAQQAAEGMTFLARAGFDVNEVLGATEGTLRLAQAGALDLGSAADIASNILTGFRLEVDQTARVVDVLAFTANNANTTVGQMGEGMKFVAPVAAGLGVSIETASAAIAALSDAGLQASLAGTGLRRVLSELESPSKKTRDILASVGLTADSVKVSQVGLIEAMTKLRDAGVDTGTALEIFGDRGGPAFEVLSSSLPKVQAMELALGNVEGTAANLAAEMDNNLNGSLLATKSAAEALILAFGDSGATGSLRGFFDVLANVLRSGAANVDVLINAITALTILFGARFAASIAISTAALVAKNVALVRAAQASAALGIAQTRMGAAFGPPTAAAIAQTGAMSRLALAQAGAASAGRGLLAVFGGPLGLAITAVGGALFYMWNEAKTAEANITELEASASDTRQGLVELQLKAKEAGIEVDGLGGSARSSNPLINAITLGYNQAADAADRLGKSARFAAIEVARAEIVNLKVKRSEQGSKRTALGLDLDISGIQRLSGALGFGPTLDERAKSIAGINTEIAQLTESIRILKLLPESSFDTPKPEEPLLPDAPGSLSEEAAGKKTQAQKDAARLANQAADEIKRQTEVLLDFNSATLQEIELLGLSNREAGKRAQLFALQDQLGRKLTETETKMAKARIDSVEAARDIAFLRAYTDQLELENQKLLDVMPGHEARNALLEKEAELGRALNEPEADRITGLIDENIALTDQKNIYDRLNGRRDTAIRQLEAIQKLTASVSVLEGASGASGGLSEADQRLARSDIGLVKGLGSLDQELGGQFAMDDSLNQIQLQQDERLRIIQEGFDLELLSREEFNARKVAIEEDSIRQIRALQVAEQSIAINAAQSTAESLASIAKDLAGEQSAVYRGMFIAAKAFAIADSIIKIQQGIANALSLPFPANLAAAAAVAAQAASIISNIRSVALQLADGGYVQGPGTGRSDSIPANLSDGEYVVNARSTSKYLGLLEAINSGRDPMRFAEGGLVARNDNDEGKFNRSETRTTETTGRPASSGAPQLVMANGATPEVNLRIINVTDPKQVEAFFATPEGEQVFVNMVNKNPEVIARAAQG